MKTMKRVFALLLALTLLWAMGITAFAAEEKGSITIDNATVDVTYTIYRIFDLESYISREFARRIGAAEEEAFFTGNGTGKPTGLLHTTGGAEVGVTTKNATALTFDEVMDLFYSLRAPYRRNAVFMTNDATMKVLRQLKNGNGDYIWQPSVTAGTPDTILNRPVYTSTFMPTITAGAKTMVFGDMNYYWIADREGRKFQRLNELYAPTGQVGFLASQRVDGKLILPEAVKVLQMKAA